MRDVPVWSFYLQVISCVSTIIWFYSKIRSKIIKVFLGILGWGIGNPLKNPGSRKCWLVHFCRIHLFRRIWIRNFQKLSHYDLTSLGGSLLGSYLIYAMVIIGPGRLSLLDVLLCLAFMVWTICDSCFEDPPIWPLAHYPYSNTPSIPSGDPTVYRSLLMYQANFICVVPDFSWHMFLETILKWMVKKQTILFHGNIIYEGNVHELAFGIKSFSSNIIMKVMIQPL